MIYFTSDLHFGHSNIIKYQNRPFENLHEMNKKLIENWNNKINKEDTIYILGDFSFKNKSKSIEYLKRLNGNKILIRGNHDDNRTIKAFNILGYKVYDYLKIEVIDEETKKKQILILMHYPILSWNQKDKGSWHLYGHVHRRIIDMPNNSLNVGVDIHDFTPISYQQVKELIRGKI